MVARSNWLHPSERQHVSVGLQVHFDPDVTGPRVLIEAVEDAGFDAHIVDTDRYIML